MLFNDLLAFLQRRLCNMIRPLNYLYNTKFIVSSSFYYFGQFMPLCNIRIRAAGNGFMQYKADVGGEKSLPTQFICFLLCILFPKPTSNPELVSSYILSL